MDDTEIKYFVESAMLAAGRPLSIDQLQGLFDDSSIPEKSRIRQAIGNLVDDYEHRGITISEVASGFRIQVKSSMADRLQKLWEEKPPRYSRALFETLALIAYRQPMTRGDIEEIRGVAVSPNIVRSLLEREWVRVVGHRDVPGRPAMFGTTKAFLDYFGLKKLDDLPPLADLSDWESLRVQLNLPAVDEDEVEAEPQVEMAEVTEIPVLRQEDAVGRTEDTGSRGDPEHIEDVNAEDDIPDIESALTAEHELEELVAKEWPSPEVGAPVTIAVDHSDELDDSADGDASASGS